jgi:hypothetical protein
MKIMVGLFSIIISMFFIYVVFTIMGFWVIVSKGLVASLWAWVLDMSNNLTQKEEKNLNLEFFPVCFFTKRHSQMHVCQMLGGRGQQDTEWQLTWFCKVLGMLWSLRQNWGSLLGWRSIVGYNICQAFYAVDEFLPRARFMPFLIFFYNI